MEVVKIGLATQDAATARSVGRVVEGMGCAIAGTASQYAELVELMRQATPDVLVVDTEISAASDQSEMLESSTRLGVPVVFLGNRNSSDSGLSLKGRDPGPYVVKPVSRTELLAAIRISTQQVLGGRHSARLVIRDGTSLRSMLRHKVVFVESRDNYLRVVVTDNQEYLVRNTLEEFLSCAPGFMQTHRSFAVSMDKVMSLSPGELHVLGHTLPIGRSFRQAVNYCLLLS